MPFCSECSTEFDDRIRRCPHCGAGAPAGSEPAASDADFGFDETPDVVLSYEQQRRSQHRVVVWAVTIIVLAIVGVICWPGSTPEAETITKTANHTPHRAVRRTVSHSGRDRVTPVPPEQDLKITGIVRDDRGIVLSGTCSSLGAVRIEVEGRPAVIEPSGNEFWARIPGRPEVLLVEAFSLDGRAELAVKIPDTLAAPPHDDTVLLSHAERQTVHEREIKLLVDGGGLHARRRTETVVLPNVKNNIAIAGRRFTLFRAPEGLVFLRVTKKGQYAFLREVDGQEMVLIPKGIAYRGFGDKGDTSPRHVVETQAFLLDRTEVTNAQYGKFLAHMRRRNDRTLRHHEDPNMELKPWTWGSDTPSENARDLPVTGVSWYAAYAYCRFVRGRLPTETEWERAAAGPHGARYPWASGGDGEEAGDADTEFADLAVLHQPGLAPAESFPGGESPFSILHLTGNAGEWCADRYDPRWYTRSRRKSPRGPTHGRHRVMRGGTYLTPKRMLEKYRLQSRGHLDAGASPADVGFRVARSWKQS